MTPEDELARWRDAATRWWLMLMGGTSILVGGVQAVLRVDDLVVLAWAGGVLLLGTGIAASEPRPAHRLVAVAVPTLLWVVAHYMAGWLAVFPASVPLLVGLATLLSGVRAAALALATMVASSLITGGLFAAGFVDTFTLDLSSGSAWAIAGASATIVLVAAAFGVRTAVELHESVRVRVEETADVLRRQVEERKRLQDEEGRLLDSLESTWSLRLVSAIGPTLGPVFNNALTAANVEIELARKTMDPADIASACNVVAAAVDVCKDKAATLLALARDEIERHDDVLATPLGADLLSQFSTLSDALDVDASPGLVVNVPANLLDRIVLLTFAHVLGKVPARSPLLVRARRFLPADASSAADLVALDVVAHSPAGDWPEADDALAMGVLSETVRRVGGFIELIDVPGAPGVRVFLPAGAAAPMDEIAVAIPPAVAGAALTALLFGLAAVAVVVGPVIAWIRPGQWWIAALAFVLAVPLAVAGRFASWPDQRRVGVLVLVLAIAGGASIARVGFVAPAALATLGLAAVAAASFGTRLHVAFVTVATVATFVAGAAMRPTATAVVEVSPVQWFVWSLLVAAIAAVTVMVVAHPLRRARRELDVLAELRGSLAAQSQAAERTGRAVVELVSTQSDAEGARIAGQRASMLAHDMNNCLMVMGGWATHLAEGWSPDEGLDAMHLACLNAQAVVESFGHTSHHVERHAPFRIETALRRMEPVLRSVVSAPQELTVTIRDPDMWAVGDEHQLRRALLNLVMNARDAIDADGAISITVTRDGPMARIAVRDDGHGMDERTLEQATDPFFTTKGASGTGLGLHSVEVVVRRLGGRLEIASSPGAGSELALVIPGHTVTAATPITRPAPSASMRVLLADDDAMVLRSLSRAMAYEGFTVTAVNDGTQAYEAAGGSHDALCIDAVMPGRPPVEVVGAFRAANGDAPVIVMSGYDLESAEELTDVRLLRKPFHVRDLVELLRAQES